ncbi:hypothetical protein BJV82DRAFT_621928 [Fennellomyces sp. T-0311]|nr:hypothetical protein BJV82DRAFT_621928 [Fennellomyces sp. T-0311]
MLRLPTVPDNERDLNNPSDPAQSHSPLFASSSESTSSRRKWRRGSTQSSGHFADLARSYTETGEMHKLAYSHDSQILNSRIDHQSLMDALHSDSDEKAGSQESTDSFDRESIELAVSDNDDSDNDDDDDDDVVGNAGSETLMEILSAQKDLEQQMKAIEQEEKDECATEEFEVPSFLRVLYMGAASEKDKRVLLKKISQAFATLFYYDSPSYLRNPKMFKERKHHLLLMTLVPDEHDDDLIETCEDNGLSIIEADFTWSTVSMETNNLTSMIEQYVWMQCEAARQDPTVWKAPDAFRNNFDGFVYPDRAPNGIDLCVYFYDTNEKPKDRLRAEEDLEILWRLKRLGIPIMPILSGGRNTPISPTRSRSQHLPRPAPTIDERRAQFADMLAQYKIRCVDISLSKLDVGRPPSFQKKKAYPPSSSTVPGLEKRLGKDWAASSMTTPAPYQILTIDQFAALDRQTVFSILKQSRQKAIKREKMLNMIRTRECIDPSSEYDAVTSITTMGVIRNKARLLVSLLALLLMFIIAVVYLVTSQPTHKSWTLTAVVGMSDEADGSKQSLSFAVELGDEKESVRRASNSRYECVVALPSCISEPPQKPLAKLNVQFPYPINFTQIDFQCPLLNLSEWQGSSEKHKPTPDVTTDTKSITNDDQDRSRPRIWGYWKHLYHTTNYLFDHQSKILNLVFNSK